MRSIIAATIAATGLMAAATPLASAHTHRPDATVTSWQIGRVAGDDSEGNAIPGLSASFVFPGQVAVDGSGNVLTADTYGNKIRAYAATSGTFYGVPMTAGDMYDVAGHGSLGDLDEPDQVGLVENGLPGTETNTSYPSGVAVDANDNLVIANSSANHIQVLAATSGTFYGQAMTAGDMYTIADENGAVGLAGDGGPAISAEMDAPGYVSLDSHGNVIIADTYNDAIRVIAETTGTFYRQAMTAGDIYTVAGDGTAGYNGDGIAATSAELYQPREAVVDSDGNLVIADNYNNRIRVVAESTGTFYGIKMTAGDIYTVAGNGTAGYRGDKGLATSAEINDSLGGVTIDPAGNLVLPDTNNGRVRVVAAVSGTYYGVAMKAKNIYTIAGTGTLGDTGNGGLATKAELGYTDSAAFDGHGNLVIDDGVNLRVLATSSGTFYGQSMTANHIYQIAGTNADAGFASGVPATSDDLNSLDALSPAPGGGLATSELYPDIVQMVAGTSGTYYGEAMTAGDVYTVAGDFGYGDTGNGGPATSASLSYVRGLAEDANGNLLLADEDSYQIRIVANTSGTYYGQAMTAGDIYALAGNGTFGYSGIGGPATSAEIGAVRGVALDANGNVLLTTGGSVTANERVLVVAEHTGTYYGQAMTAGDIYLVAGSGPAGYTAGKATNGEFDLPTSVSVDSSGNVVICDENNQRIRVVAESTGTFYGFKMTAGDVYAVAGTGQIGTSANGTQATKALLNYPHDVKVDSHGNLVITDSGNNEVRVVAASTGTFYGIAMKAHDIYTVAGSGAYGYSGDGGPAASAEMGFPITILAEPSGNSQGDDLYLTDAGNSLIREVSPAGGEAVRAAVVDGRSRQTRSSHTLPPAIRGADGAG